MSRDAYWRNQRTRKPTAYYACPDCGAPTFAALPLPQHTCRIPGFPEDYFIPEPPENEPDEDD
jgi:hypothetical protein